MSVFRTVDIGQLAEELAADWLISKGFEIIERNWRNRFHEIDIIASKERIIHIVEVKYRRSDQYGSAVEYVTPYKLKRVIRAARAWVVEKRPFHDGMQIDVISVDGAVKPKLQYYPNVYRN